MENNLAIILSGCKQGIPAWQKVLYEQYYGFAYTICIRYAPTKEDTTEIINDGFVNVFKGLSNFNFPENENELSPAFMGWLKRIMIHIGINHEKSHARQIAWRKPDLETEKIPSVHLNPLESLAYEELVKLIHKLSPAYRHVFSLFVLDGCSHEEIARITKTSIGTSKSNLLKARRQLRKMIEVIHAEEISKYDR